MSSNLNNDDESFIILGSSPGTSLDVKCNGLLNGMPLNKEQLEDALKEMSEEANQAFKAHFKLGDCPSLANMMVASHLVTEDKSTVELQKKFGDLLDENTILKETLKQNNDSMKEQFLLIASCQEDMMKTHMLHKEKFDETRELVERLRQENKKLKLDIVRLADGELTLSNVKSHSTPNSMLTSQRASTTGSKPQSLSKTENNSQLTSAVNAQTNSLNSLAGGSVTAANLHVADSQGEVSSGPISALEFVTSPDDDIVNKLTQQLELVEKQRRQVIVENEKLSWQKESLEHIVDATSRERDEIKDKLKDAELQLSTKDSDCAYAISKLKTTIQQLRSEIIAIRQANNTSAEKSKDRDAIIEQLEGKIATLQSELKTSQLRILELENVKLEFSRYKSSLSDTIRTYKEQIQDLQNKLKEAQTLVFQPVSASMAGGGGEGEGEGESPDAVTLSSNVKLYDTSLKHLAEYLNCLTNGTSSSISGCMALVPGLRDVGRDGPGEERLRKGLDELKHCLDSLYSHTLANIGQIRSCLTIFEGIFQDCKQLINKQQIMASESSTPVTSSPPASVLSAALISREQELLALRLQLRQQSDVTDECQLLRAQLDVYKSDFETERSGRASLAGTLDLTRAELARTKARVQDLEQMLQAARLSGATVSPARPAPSSRPGPAPARSGPSSDSSTGVAPNIVMVYKCPKCMRFSSDNYKVMEDHFDYCLED